MKFYIFGNTTKNKDMSCNTKKAIFASDDFEACLYKLKNFVRELRFTNCYLIADFGTYKKKSLFAKTINDYDEMMPFFIVAEWHIGEDKDLLIRSDYTVITKGGFVHEFMNNANAVREVLYCINNNIEFTLEILYYVPVTIMGHKELKEINKIITSSSIMIENSKSKGVKRFKLNSPEWISPKIERTFKPFEIQKQKTAKEDIFYLLFCKTNIY